jgi:hypothetical protein
MKTIDGNGKPLISFKDAFTIRSIENFKLAEMYLANKVEENEKKAMQESQALQAQNAQVQQESAQQAQQGEMAMQQQKLQYDNAADKAKTENEAKLAIINGVFGVAMKSPTGELPTYLQPLAAAAISNIMMPLVAENSQMQQGLQMVAQAQQAMQQQQAHPEMQNQEQQPEQQGQPPMQPQQPQPQAA